ncbi:hypothetical protein ACJZ2D_011452 [Fusarium nematophilum]
MSGGRRLFLVDIPGFDDTKRRDTDTFKDIALYFGQAYTHRAYIGGILYLYHISNNRVPSSATRSFRLIKQHVWLQAAKFALLVLTVWEGTPLDSGLYDRAKQSQGSQTHRWLGTRASALSIIGSLLWLSENQGPVSFQIQKELAYKQKDLDDTAAGTELSKHYGAVWQRAQQELKTLRESSHLAEEVQDTRFTESLEAQKTELERQVAAAETAERDLRDSLESLFLAKTEEYQKRYLTTKPEPSELFLQVQLLQDELITLKKQEQGEDADVSIEEGQSHDGTIG